MLLGLSVMISETWYKTDLKDMLTEFTKVISALLKMQLQMDDKRKIEASAGSLQDIFEMYLITKNPELLTHLLFTANDLVHQSFSLLLLTVPTFGIVGSIELSILQEIYISGKKNGQKQENHTGYRGQTHWPSIKISTCSS